jgi:peptidoglycan/LPS O-acetylase OafA/YrhL
MGNKQGIYLDSLDGIRAISIFLVLGSHAKLTNYINLNINNISITNYLFNGILGVVIFFVLSGFLITYLLIYENRKNNDINIKKFYIRRLFRIFPVYYLNIIFLIFFSYFTDFNLGLREVIISLFCLGDFFSTQWVMSHYWSLSIEQQFYLFWPFVVKYSINNTKFFFILIFLLTILSPIFRVIFFYNGLIFLKNFSIFSNIQSLTIGTLFAFLYFNYSSTLISILNFKTSFFRLLFVFVIYLFWVLDVSGVLKIVTVPFGYTVISLCIGYLIVSLITIKKGISYKILNNQVVKFFGKISYSIYIWQQFIFSDIFSNHFNIHVLTKLILILVCSIISYNLIEKQFIKLQRKFIT